MYLLVCLYDKFTQNPHIYASNTKWTGLEISYCIYWDNDEVN